MEVFIYKYYHNPFGYKRKHYFVGYYWEALRVNDYSSPVFEQTTRLRYIKSFKEFFRVYRPGMHIKLMTNKSYQRMVDSWNEW